MDGGITLNSVAQIHELLGYEPPAHPLITLLTTDRLPGNLPLEGRRVLSELYAVGLKNGGECPVLYGHRPYDFGEGTLLFLAPGQILIPLGESRNGGTPPFPGWTLVFHPDLIRDTPLGERIGTYSFFLYESREALYLTGEERPILTGIIEGIDGEIRRGGDRFSKGILSGQIELLLNYSRRFYDRQFQEGERESSELLDRWERFLMEYFRVDRSHDPGLLKVETAAREMGYSSHYFGDLIKKISGRSAQEHIQHALLERAKDRLARPEASVQGVAYSLGFDYPQHFSQFFKGKTGLSPGDYRTSLFSRKRKDSPEEI